MLHGGVGRVEDLLLVCLVIADRALTPVDFVVTASALLLCVLFRWILDLVSLAVEWQLSSGDHCLLIAMHVDLSRCFCIFAVFEHGSVHEIVGLQCFVARYVALLQSCFLEERVGPVSAGAGHLLFCMRYACLPTYLESVASGSSFAPPCALKSPPISMCVCLPTSAGVLVKFNVHLLSSLASVSHKLW